MLFGKKKVKKKSYDPSLTPVIHASICTGEQVAGFENAQGQFEEVMLIRNAADLQAFADEYGVDLNAIVKKY